MFNELMPTGRRFDPSLRFPRAREDGNYDTNRLFGGLRLAPQLQFPMLNVYASADGAVLTAEVPGIDPEKLDIAVHQDTVSIKGSRELEDFGHEAVVHRQERPSGTFARSFVLPFHVAVDKVSARFDRGILHLDLPRPDEDKPRQIKITH